MKTVYKCEYCDKWEETEELIIEHEEKCGYNPKNEITDEMVLKLSRINEHFEDSLIYVLTEDFNEDLKYYSKEFERSTTNNCPASIYEEKTKMINLLFYCKAIQKDKNNFNYFKRVTKIDNPELIQAIRTYFREPEFRV